MCLPHTSRGLSCKATPSTRLAGGLQRQSLPGTLLFLLAHAQLHSDPLSYKPIVTGPCKYLLPFCLIHELKTWPRTELKSIRLYLLLKQDPVSAPVPQAWCLLPALPEPQGAVRRLHVLSVPSICSSGRGDKFIGSDFLGVLRVPSPSLGSNTLLSRLLYFFTSLGWLPLETALT